MRIVERTKGFLVSRGESVINVVPFSLGFFSLLN